MKTSLGNVLDPHVRSPDRWRSSSDAGVTPKPPGLFKSMREAMEYDAERASSPATRNYARAVSSFDQAEADEAGYTVIRRRAASDLTSDRTTQTQRRKQTQPPGNSRKKPTENVHGASAASPSLRRKSKRHPGPTRSTADEQLESPWVQVASPHSQTTVPVVSAGLRTEEERWLAAASAGAVQPAHLLTKESAPTPETDQVLNTHAPAHARMDEDSEPRVETQEATSQASEGGAPQSTDASIDASMISWLERTLALDDL